MSNNIPNPILRKEKYLAKIAENTAGGGADPVVLMANKNITANGVVNPNSGFDGFAKVTVQVPNTYTAQDEGKVVSDGALISQVSTSVNSNNTYDTTYYNEVTVNVPNTYTAQDEGKVVDNGTLTTQTSRTVTVNDTYTTTTNNQVIVNVPNTYTVSDEGKVVDNGALTAQTSRNVTVNDTYDTTLNNSVTVAVPNTYTAQDEGKVVDNGALVSQTSANINTNGTHTTTTNNEVVVAVPNTYTAGDEGKVVSSGALVAQTAYPSTITVNDTYDTTNYNSITVDVPAPSPTLLTKNITINGTYNAVDDSADGYDSVSVNVIQKMNACIPLGTSSSSTIQVAYLMTTLDLATPTADVDGYMIFASSKAAFSSTSGYLYPIGGLNLSDYFSDNHTMTANGYAKDSSSQWNPTLTLDLTNNRVSYSISIATSSYSYNINFFGGKKISVL